MESLPSWLNPLDALIVFALLGGVVWGFLRGLVRMVLSLLVLYIATVLAMSFYGQGGRLLSYLSGGAIGGTMSEALAFVLILVLTTSIVNFVLSRTYKNTELPGVRQIDQLGGMIAGFLLVAVWIGLSVVALAFVLSNTAGAGSAFLQTVQHYFVNSSLIPMFYRFLPLVLATLRPWMPQGISPDIFSLRFF